MTEEFTIGGMAAAEAYHWNHQTYQMLGESIYKMQSGKAQLRREGYLAYFELRRFFMQSEWDEYIAALEQYRVSRNGLAIEILLQEIRAEFVESGAPADSNENHANDPVQVQFEFRLNLSTWSDNVQQTDLFGG